MLRSEFIRLAALGTAWLTGRDHVFTAEKKPIKAKYKKLYTGSVAGMYYYDAESVLPSIVHMDELELRREPANRYDHRAIEVYFKGRKLGYVARVDNEVLANLMDGGTKLFARAKVKQQQESYHQQSLNFSVYYTLN
jgi:hypothetical protein